MPVVNPRVPEGLRDLMKGLTKEILREKPTNIYEFSANFFESMLHEKHDCTVNRYEPTIANESIYLNRERHQIPVALVFKIIPEKLTELIKEFIKAVLRANPANICKFGVEYFRRLQKNECFKNGNIQYTAYENYFKSKERLSFTPYAKCTCGRTFGEGIVQVSDVNKSTTQENVGQYTNEMLKDISTAKCMDHLPKAMQESSTNDNSLSFESKPKQLIDQDSANESIAKVHDEAYINAIYVIQRFYRSWVSRKHAKDFSNESSQTTRNSMMSEEAAALIIQRSLRKLFKEKSLRNEKHFAIIPNIENVQHLDENNESNSEAASYTSASTAQLCGESAAEAMDREYLEVDTIVSEEQALTQSTMKDHEKPNDVAGEIDSGEKTMELTANRAEHAVAHHAVDSLIIEQNELKSGESNNLTIFAEKDSNEEEKHPENVEESVASNYSCQQNSDRSLDSINPREDLTEQTPSASLEATDLDELPTKEAHSTKDSNMIPSNVDSTEDHDVEISMEECDIGVENQNHKNIEETTRSVDRLKENTSIHSEESNAATTSIKDNIAEHEEVSTALDEANIADKDEAKNGVNIKMQVDDVNSEMTSDEATPFELENLKVDLSKVKVEKDTPKMTDLNEEEDSDAQSLKKGQSCEAVDAHGNELCNENTEDSQTGNQDGYKKSNSAEVEGSPVELNKDGPDEKESQEKTDQAVTYEVETKENDVNEEAVINEDKVREQSKDSFLMHESAHLSEDEKLIQTAEENAESNSYIEESHENNENSGDKNQQETINETDAEVNNENECLSFKAEEHVVQSATNSETHEETAKKDELGNGTNSESMEADIDNISENNNEISKVDNAQKAVDLEDKTQKVADLENHKPKNEQAYEIEVLNQTSLGKQDSEELHDDKVVDDTRDLSLGVKNIEDDIQSNNDGKVTPNDDTPAEASKLEAGEIQISKSYFVNTETVTELSTLEHNVAIDDKCSTSIETVGQDTKILSNSSIDGELTESDKHAVSQQQCNDNIVMTTGVTSPKKKNSNENAIVVQYNSAGNKTEQQESFENPGLKETGCQNAESVLNDAELESNSADNLPTRLTEETEVTEASDTPEQTLAKNDIEETLIAEEYDAQNVGELRTKKSLDETQIQDECINSDIDELITKQVILQEDNDMQKEESAIKKILDNEETSSNDNINKSNVNLSADIEDAEVDKQDRTKRSLASTKIAEACENLECHETITEQDTMQELNELQIEESSRGKLQANAESALTDLNNIDESNTINEDIGCNEISTESNVQAEAKDKILESLLEDQFGNKQDIRDNLDNSTTTTNSSSLHSESDEAQHENSQDASTSNTESGMHSARDVNSDNSSTSNTPYELLMAETHLKSFLKAKDIDNSERPLNLYEELNTTKITNELTSQEPTMFESVDNVKNNQNQNSNDILPQNEAAVSERPERSATYLYGFHTPPQTEIPACKSGPKSYTAFDIPNQLNPNKPNNKISPKHELDKLNLTQELSNDDAQSEIDLETPTKLFAELNMFDDIAMDETITVAEQDFSNKPINLLLNVDTELDLNDANQTHTPPNGLLNTIMEQNETESPRKSESEIPSEIKTNIDNNLMEGYVDNMNYLKRTFEPLEYGRGCGSGSGSENGSDLTSSWSCSKETDENFYSDECLNESSNESMAQPKISASNFTSDGTMQGGVYEMAPIGKTLVDVTNSADEMDKRRGKSASAEKLETFGGPEIVDKNADLVPVNRETNSPQRAENKLMNTKTETETEPTAKDADTSNLITESSLSEKETGVLYTNSIVKSASESVDNDSKLKKIKSTKSNSMDLQSVETETNENDGSNSVAENGASVGETKFSKKVGDINTDSSLLTESEKLKQGESTELIATKQKRNDETQPMAENDTNEKGFGNPNENSVIKAKLAVEVADKEVDEVNVVENKPLAVQLYNDKNHTAIENGTSENEAFMSNSNSVAKTEITVRNKNAEANESKESPIEVKSTRIAKMATNISTLFSENEPSEEKDTTMPDQNSLTTSAIIDKSKDLAACEVKDNVGNTLITESSASEKETGVLITKMGANQIKSDSLNDDKNKSLAVQSNETENKQHDRSSSVTGNESSEIETKLPNKVDGPEESLIDRDLLLPTKIKPMESELNQLIATEQKWNEKTKSMAENDSNESGFGDLNNNSVIQYDVVENKLMGHSLETETETTEKDTDKNKLVLENSSSQNVAGFPHTNSVLDSNFAYEDKDSKLNKLKSESVLGAENISMELQFAETAGKEKGKSMSKPGNELREKETKLAYKSDGPEESLINSSFLVLTEAKTKLRENKLSQLTPTKLMAENGFGDLNQNSVFESKSAVENADIEVDKINVDLLHGAENNEMKIQLDNDNNNIVIESGTSENETVIPSISEILDTKVAIELHDSKSNSLHDQDTISKSMEEELKSTAEMKNDKNTLMGETEPIEKEIGITNQNSVESENEDKNKDLELDRVTTSSALAVENELMDATMETETRNPLHDAGKKSIEDEFALTTEMTNNQNYEFAKNETSKVVGNEPAPHEPKSNLVMGTANNLLDEIFTKIAEQNNEKIKKSITKSENIKEEVTIEPKSSVILTQNYAEDKEHTDKNKLETVKSTSQNDTGFPHTDSVMDSNFAHEHNDFKLKPENKLMEDELTENENRTSAIAIETKFINADNYSGMDEINKDPILLAEIKATDTEATQSIASKQMQSDTNKLAENGAGENGIGLLNKNAVTESKLKDDEILVAENKSMEVTLTKNSVMEYEKTNLYGEIQPIEKGNSNPHQNSVMKSEIVVKNNDLEPEKLQKENKLIKAQLPETAEKKNDKNNSVTVQSSISSTKDHDDWNIPTLAVPILAEDSNLDTQKISEDPLHDAGKKSIEEEFALSTEMANNQNYEFAKNEKSKVVGNEPSPHESKSNLVMGTANNLLDEIFTKIAEQNNEKIKKSITKSESIKEEVTSVPKNSAENNELKFDATKILYTQLETSLEPGVENESQVVPLTKVNDALLHKGLRYKEEVETSDNVTSIPNLTADISYNNIDNELSQKNLKVADSILGVQHDAAQNIELAVKKQGSSTESEGATAKEATALAEKAPNASSSKHTKQSKAEGHAPDDTELPINKEQGSSTESNQATAMEAVILATTIAKKVPRASSSERTKQSKAEELAPIDTDLLITKKQAPSTESDRATTMEATILATSTDKRARRASSSEQTKQLEAENLSPLDTDLLHTSTLTKHDLDFMDDTISELKAATLALTNIEQLMTYAPSPPTDDPLEVAEQQKDKESLQSANTHKSEDNMNVSNYHAEDAHLRTVAANETTALLVLVQSAIIIQNAFRKYITRKKFLAHSNENALQQELVPKISDHKYDMEHTGALPLTPKQNSIDEKYIDSINKDSKIIGSDKDKILTAAALTALKESESQKNLDASEDSLPQHDNSERAKRSIDPMDANIIPNDEHIDDDKLHRVKVNWYVGEEPKELLNVSAKPETIPKDIADSALVDLDTNTSSLPNPNASIETATSPSINSIPAAKVDKSTSSLLQPDSKTISNNTNLKSSDNTVSAFEMNDDLPESKECLKEQDKLEEEQEEKEEFNSKSADLLQAREHNNAENLDEQEVLNTNCAETQQDEEKGNNATDSGNIHIAEEDTSNSNSKQEAEKTNVVLNRDESKETEINLTLDPEDRKEDIVKDATHKDKQDLKETHSCDSNSNREISADFQPEVPDCPDTASRSETIDLTDVNELNDNSLPDLHSNSQAEAAENQINALSKQPQKDLDLATEFINSRTTKHWNITSKDAKQSKENNSFDTKHSIMDFINSEKQYWESDIPYSILEEPCIRKSVSLSRLETEDENLENSSTEVQSNTSLADPDNDEVDSLGAKTAKLHETDAIIKKMQQRRASETRTGSMDERLSQEASFDEPIIRSMKELHDSNSTEVDDEEVVVLQRLQREETRESSGHSDSVVYGVDNSKHNEHNIELDQSDIKKASLQRLYTIPGDDAKMLFKSVTIDETVQYIEPPECETTATSGSSFCLDEDTSENIRQKIMAYSLSEADSELLGAEATDDSFSMDRPKERNDDFNITTALVDITGTSTDTESTIVSAATKIQAGARGFLTRRRLRRASLGTKSSLQENSKASFGNAAIDESLEKLVEEEAARKIQAAFRKHYRQNGINSLPAREQKTKKEFNLNSSVGCEALETFKFSSFESPLAARRHTLQRGDAMRNGSTPDGNGSSRNDSREKSLSPENAAPANAVEFIEVMKNEKSENNSIESTTSAAAAAVGSKKINNELKWIAQRQHSMPVQIESEVFRVIPKHMRKRIKSADGEKKKRPRVLKD